MKKVLYLSLIILFLFPWPSRAAEQISIICNIITIEKYNKVVKSKGGDPFVIRNFSSPYADRPVVNLILIAQALHEGGMEFDFDFIVSPNPRRGVAEVKAGRAVMYQADMWQQSFDDSVYISNPIIFPGQFAKGLYVAEDSPLLHDDVDLKTLQNTPLLIETTWEYDIETLEQAGFKNILTTSKYENMLEAARKRNLMTFLEFPNSKDLVHKTKYGDLYPIPNIKVIFQEGRHFMVSKKHPNGKKVFSALQKGLKKLRKEGIIKKAQRESGVINHRVDDWKVLNNSSPSS